MTQLFPMVSLEPPKQGVVALTVRMRPIPVKTTML